MTIPPDLSPTFLRMVELNRQNLETVLGGTKNEHTVQTGVELSEIPYSGLYIESQNVQSVARRLNASAFPTSKIVYRELLTDETLEDYFKEMSLSTNDGAILFDQNHVSNYFVLDGDKFTALIGYMWEQINKHDPILPNGDTFSNQYTKRVLSQHIRKIDFRNAGHGANNPALIFMEGLLRVTKRLHEKIAEPRTGLHIENFYDILPSITPQDYTLLQRGQDAMAGFGFSLPVKKGSKSQTADAMILELPGMMEDTLKMENGISVHIIKHTVYAPPHAASTNTGKVIELKYNPTDKTFKSIASYFIKAKDPAWISQLPDGLSEKLDLRRHRIHGNYCGSSHPDIAAVVQISEGPTLDPHNLPPTRAFLLEMDSSGQLHYPKSPKDIVTYTANRS